MASNELGLFMADFVAPTYMAADIAADSVVQSVKVGSPSSLTIEISSTSYPDPFLLSSCEQLIAREYHLNKVIISHELDAAATESETAHASYCEELIPWLLSHLQSAGGTAYSLPAGALSYDRLNNIYVLAGEDTARTREMAESIQKILSENTAAKCKVKIDNSVKTAQKNKIQASRKEIQKKNNTGKLIWEIGRASCRERV